MNNYPTDPEVSNIFRAMDALQRARPDRKMGNPGSFLGQLGEEWAVQALNLTQCKEQQAGYNAVTADGITVQIKTTKANSTTFSAKDPNSAQLLLVVRLNDDFEFEINFYDNTPIKAFRFNQYYNRYDITWTKKSKSNPSLRRDESF